MDAPASPRRKTSRRIYPGSVRICLPAIFPITIAPHPRIKRIKRTKYYSRWLWCEETAKKGRSRFHYILRYLVHLACTDCRRLNPRRQLSLCNPTNFITCSDRSDLALSICPSSLHSLYEKSEVSELSTIQEGYIAKKLRRKREESIGACA